MQYNNQKNAEKKNAENSIISEIKIFLVIITSNQKCQNSLFMNYVIDCLHAFDLFLLWCSENFDTTVSYKHDRYSRGLKTITVLL